MFSLELSADQIETRDAVRSFVVSEVLPRANQASRLEAPNAPLPRALLAAAAQLGLRSFMLDEEHGGIGADTLTACLVAEELGAGDAGLAAELAQTCAIAATVFQQLASPTQRDAWLPGFLGDDNAHFCHAAPELDEESEWAYHRPTAPHPQCDVRATPDGAGWRLDGATGFVANGAIATHLLVHAFTNDGHELLFLIDRRSPGVLTRDAYRVEGGSDASVATPFAGRAARLIFERCAVGPARVLETPSLARALAGLRDRISVLMQSANLGVGRAALDSAVEYAKIRVQGGCPLIQHQAIGTLLADAAIRLDVARGAIRQAAWAVDHPEASSQALSSLPLERIARVFTSEVVHEATLLATEVFGAMGVMRDMPLQKYVHDTLVHLHSYDSNSTARLRIAESLASYRR